jgi:putative phosphoesterase
MRIAALYDIHGNLPALEAVLKEIRLADVHLVVVGGDILPGPMPRETLESLLELEIPVRFIKGNCENDAFAETRGIGEVRFPEQVKESMHWSAEQIFSEYEQLVYEWPDTLSLEVDGFGRVLFCHATPRDDNEIFTRLTPEESVLPIFEETGAAMVVCGHTHMQFDRTIGHVRVINAGSVGMPFGKPGAYWLLLDGDVKLQRTMYDLSDAAARIRQTHYPEAYDFAEKSVLHPPTEQQMLDVFSKAELR